MTRLRNYFTVECKGGMLRLATSFSEGDPVLGIISLDNEVVVSEEVEL